VSQVESVKLKYVRLVVVETMMNDDVVKSADADANQNSIEILWQ
jgi:hypothetical protein